jgi:DNA-binding beta-propeller fold protein YncE
MISSRSGHAAACATLLTAASALALPARAQAAAHNAAGYHVAQQYVLGGEGGWDYLAFDGPGKRLFITRSDRVSVVDPATGKVLGEIPGLKRGHGVALAYPTGHGFVTSGADSTVTMFDLKTLAPIKRIHAADDDDAVLYDPASKRVFTFNGDAGSATAIDPVDGTKIGDIALGGKPEFGIADGEGRLFVNIADKGEIAQLDPKKLIVVKRWAIAPCEDPSGLAFDGKHERLFSVCGNKVMAVSDAHAGKLVTTVPIGSGVDAAAYDAATGYVFASNGEGTLTVIHEDAPNRYHVVETVPTLRGARTMALDPATHRVYTASAKFGVTPAAATADNPRRRPPMIPGSFTLLVLQR